MAFPTMPRHPRADYIDPPPPISNRSPAKERGWHAGWPDDCTPSPERTTIPVVRPSDGRIFPLAVDIRLAGLFGDFLSLAQQDGRFELRSRRELSDNGNAQGGNGSFVCRAIKGTTQPSNHSSATAVDLWTRSNPLLRTGNFVSTIHPEVVELAGAALIYWGGWYHDFDGTFVDAMHFEFMATPNDVPAASAALQAKADEIRRRKEPAPAPAPSGRPRNRPRQRN